MLRTCNYCKAERDVSDFRTRLWKGKRIYYRQCKPCYNEKMRLDSNRKAVTNLRLRKRRKENPEKYRGYELKKRHKIDLDIYYYKFNEQNGVCAICKTTPQSGKHLTVDHDHSCCNSEMSCGQCLRGLLCRSCNTGLGGFSDSIENLKRAIVYLETVSVGEWKVPYA